MKMHCSVEPAPPSQASEKSWDGQREGGGSGAATPAPRIRICWAVLRSSRLQHKGNLAKGNKKGGISVRGLTGLMNL